MLYVFIILNVVSSTLCTWLVYTWLRFPVSGTSSTVYVIALPWLSYFSKSGHMYVQLSVAFTSTGFGTVFGSVYVSSVPPACSF